MRCEVRSVGTSPHIIRIYISAKMSAFSAATFVANAGTAVNDASTFDGYTIRQVVAALRGLGLLT